VPRLQTSPESPLPVRVVAQKIGAWIARLGEIWVDGQVAQLTRRTGRATQFLVLRDADANISLSVTCPRGVLDTRDGKTIAEGARVVLHARPDFYLERGTLSLRADEVRQVGLGELLARIEALRRILAAEGLFAAERKRPLPFLPRRIGVITGRASAAERDLVENARRRAPGVNFSIENVATQGASAVSEITTALRRLDADPAVEVVVIARGGGSVEDLLPFSNETLVRAVAAAHTPIIAAIGHESDVPLLNFVADVAASTPTDAAKQVVPDLAEQAHEVADLRLRARAGLRRRLDAEAELMAGVPVRMRRALAARVTAERRDAEQLRARVRRCLRGQLDAARSDLDHVRARVRALSPQATLDRGYAVVQTEGGRIVRDAGDAHGRLRIRVARGEFDAVTGA
jgi:exodeoxyribonuclease VII large subunit